MCKPTNLSARRRHRPTYLAPSPILMANDNDDDIPVPSTPEHSVDIESATTTSPQEHETSQESTPASDIAAPTSEPAPTYSRYCSTRIHVCPFIQHIYHGMMDVLLVIFVIVMSFFIYDVDVSIVKGDHGSETTTTTASQGEQWGVSSGRVVVRNDDQYGRSVRTRMASANLV